MTISLAPGYNARSGAALLNSLSGSPRRYAFSEAVIARAPRLVFICAKIIMGKSRSVFALSEIARRLEGGRTLELHAYNFALLKWAHSQLLGRRDLTLILHESIVLTRNF